MEESALSLAGCELANALVVSLATVANTVRIVLLSLVYETCVD